MQRPRYGRGTLAPAPHGSRDPDQSPTHDSSTSPCSIDVVPCGTNEHRATSMPRAGERKYAEIHERASANPAAIGQNARIVSGVWPVTAQPSSAGVIW